MEEKGKPEEEKARYRKMFDNLSAKISSLETAAQTGEVAAQARYGTVLVLVSFIMHDARAVLQVMRIPFATR